MRRESKETSTGWQCPDCGRRFVMRTKEHSCSVTPLESHLAKTSPDVRRAFDSIVDILESLGPFELEPLKTMVVFRTSSSFGGVTFTRKRLDLGFFLRRVDHSPRIRRTETISPRKIAHHVHITTPDEVDEEIESWLREAWEGVAVRK